MGKAIIIIVVAIFLSMPFITGIYLFRNIELNKPSLYIGKIIWFIIAAVAYYNIMLIILLTCF